MRKAGKLAVKWANESMSKQSKITSNKTIDK